MTANLRMAMALSVSALTCGATAIGHAEAHPVTLTGCVVRAEDGDGYLLINAPRDPAAPSPAPRATAPSTLGTITQTSAESTPRSQRSTW